LFLLPGWLEIDLTFAPEAEFGPRGPQWQTIFGQTHPLEPFAAPDPDTLAGLAWHHALHARVSIERGRWWQAEHWIRAMRDHVITLACLRLGYPADRAKNAHLLPGDLNAAISVVADEIERHDPALATRLRPMLAGLAGAASPAEPTAADPLRQS